MVAKVIMGKMSPIMVQDVEIFGSQVGVDYNLLHGVSFS
jgi:uncharacterized protein related to proFAR isomerase